MSGWVACALSAVLAGGCAERSHPAAPPSEPPPAQPADASAPPAQPADASAPCDTLLGEYAAQAKHGMLATCTSHADCACIQAVAGRYGSRFNCPAMFPGSGIVRSEVPPLRALETRLRAMSCAIESCPPAPCEARCVEGRCENTRQLPGP